MLAKENGFAPEGHQLGQGKHGLCIGAGIAKQQDGGAGKAEGLGQAVFRIGHGGVAGRSEKEIGASVGVPIDQVDFDASGAACAEEIGADGAPIFEPEFAAVVDVVGVVLPVETELVVVIERDISHAPIEERGAGFNAPGAVEVKPFIVEGMPGVELRRIGGADVEIDGVASGGVAEEDVDASVLIPIHGGGAGIAPAGFAGALDIEAVSWLDVDGLSGGLDGRARREGRGSVAGKVLEEEDEAFGISGHNIFGAVAVPVDDAGHGE